MPDWLIFLYYHYSHRMAEQQITAVGGSADAHVLSADQHVGAFLEKGEKIMASYSEHMVLFKNSMETVSSLTETVKRLETDLVSLKRPAVGDDSNSPPGKVQRRNEQCDVETESRVVDDSSDDDSSDELDQFLSGEAKN